MGGKVFRKNCFRKGRKTSLPVLIGRVRFELYGEAMIEKTVGLSGKTGRIYVPPEWVGHQVKIIKID
ncbi:MAG: DUF2080 family transposase-associated protein [Deltaproteobacteria bacterium]|nr:DUF2080 family transposase-associated protein [Deltaproteobacteria bacterium]